MRRLALLLTITACSTSHITPAPLPPLVATLPPTAAAGDELVIPGEHLIWEVAAGGMTIGRAELIVRTDQIESRFSTDGVAAMFADVHEHLVTPAARERGIYTLHSALSWLRGWHPRGASAARLAIAYDGDRYAATCEPPIPDELHDARVVRVACTLDAKDPVELTFELADDADRVPLRLVAKIGSTVVEANLVSRDLRGSAATPVATAHAIALASR